MHCGVEVSESSTNKNTLSHKGHDDSIITRVFFLSLAGVPNGYMAVGYLLFLQEQGSGSHCPGISTTVTAMPFDALALATPWCLAVRREAAGHARKRAGLGCTWFER